MKEDFTYHIPVLLEESVNGLNISPDGIYVDVTFGGGGHSRKILSLLGEKGRLYVFDQDEDTEKNIVPDARLTFIRGNFRYLSNFMDWHGVEKMDGLLADLGVSSHHFDDQERGFSFRFESKLDMRMNKKAEKTAADVLNTYSKEALSDVFYFFGELRNARAIAQAVVNQREENQIKTTSDFLEILNPFFGKEKKCLAQAFQALRIEVNEEMEALKEMLRQAEQLLNPEGRLVVITYHSLEDRLVKNFLKSGNFEGKIEKDFFGNVQSPFQLINNKVIVPSQEEIENNPRSRSAKLRIAKKK
ncbi:MAG: 16S rRNA (cytosine(1402)-N(4))-methyltransferase RsmH [Dysgonamonadaceae bacterium]|jgi:16S rRNA (cytosine1402-N4)-methyltransferase|nr:16S rRNA (cytosine(1402)-N(4))-methyltransferase RsmH [Dysgonamonadaceae bacterium]